MVGSKTVGHNKQGQRSQFGRISRFARDQRGNTYFLVAAAMLPMLGMVGSGIDIGRAYMTDLRLQQACDAGVLAGRRAMTGGTYTAANKAEANKMFRINFDNDTYGSTNIAFNTAQDGPSDVDGTASARLPTTVMKIFGHNEFDLAVNCTAKLEVSNVDVMLVLDVTGSMGSGAPGGGGSRMDALKVAVMNFFDTLTGAAIGDGRMRFGVVPYDANVNVGQIIASANTNWLRDDVTLPSRTPLYTTTWGAGVTTYGTPFDGPVSDSGNWGNNGGSISGKDSTTCSETPPPANSPPTTVGGVTQTQTGQYIDADGNRVTTYDRKQNYEYWTYRYDWNKNGGSKFGCFRQRLKQVFTRTTPSMVTQPPIPVFSKYRYEDREFDVTAAKLGGAITYNVGDKGADLTATWNGCIIERQTEPFGPSATAPADAYDMNIDMVPTSDEDTQWQIQMRDFAFTRSAEAANETTTDRQSIEEVANCPNAAMKLTTMTSSDRATFNAYIQALYPNGNTYHDAGMTWGARLISPTGIFAGENATAPNGRPIQRHLIFMTDGEMYIDTANLGFQGHEPTMQRVGHTDTATGILRHNNRFLQLCASAKTKNVTVWTVDFDSTLTPSLVTCASGADKAFLATSAATLNAQFQAIARQISKLRLSQ